MRGNIQNYTTVGPLWSGFRILLKLIFSQALRGRGHCTLNSTQGVSLHSTSSPCLQGDLLITLSTRWLISSLPRQFYPRALIIRLLVTRGCRRHQEARTIKILSILTSGASRQSIRPGPHDDHTPLLTPDMEPITGVQGPVIAE